MKAATIAAGLFVMFLITMSNLSEATKHPTYSKPTHVYIAIGSGHCSGVHIGDGYFLTASHCVNAGKQTGAPLVIDGGITEVLWNNKVSDIALLKLDEAISRAAAPLRCSKPKIGEEIYSITNPKAYRDYHAYGRVAGETITWRGNIVVPLNLSAAPGSSGGPVFDMEGNVLGLIVSGPQPFGNVTNMAPSYRVCELMGRSGEFTDG